MGKEDNFNKMYSSTESYQSEEDDIEDNVNAKNKKTKNLHLYR